MPRERTRQSPEPQLTSVIPRVGCLRCDAVVDEPFLNDNGIEILQQDETTTFTLDSQVAEVLQGGRPRYSA